LILLYLILLTIGCYTQGITAYTKETNQQRYGMMKCIISKVIQEMQYRPESMLSEAMEKVYIAKAKLFL